MPPIRFGILAILLSVLVVDISWAQRPRRGGEGGGRPRFDRSSGSEGGGRQRFGRPGGEDGGRRGRPGGSEQGGGRRFGRPGGGPEGGGRRGGGFDPNMIFDRFSGGKDVIVRSELDPGRQRFFDMMASRTGIKGDRITREQFVSAVEQRMSQGGFGRSRGSGSDNARQIAESSFRRRDTNRDGVLTSDEMSDTLRKERERWDQNRDGVIDLNEYIPYVSAYMDRNRRGGGDTDDRDDDRRGRESRRSSDDDDDDGDEIEGDFRPTVYYYGNLPEGLPSWFKELDIDKDGQIGLYEWRAAEKDVPEFFGLDFNRDGLITPIEMLKHQERSETSKESGRGGRRE